MSQQYRNKLIQIYFLNNGNKMEVGRDRCIARNMPHFWWTTPVLGFFWLTNSSSLFPTKKPRSQTRQRVHSHQLCLVRFNWTLFRLHRDGVHLGRCECAIELWCGQKKNSDAPQCLFYVSQSRKCACVQFFLVQCHHRRGGKYVFSNVLVWSLTEPSLPDYKVCQMTLNYSDTFFCFVDFLYL